MGVLQATIASGGFQIEDVLFLNGTMDLDGVADALIFDAAGGLTLSAPTSNQLDLKINGADDFSWTANSYNILSGSVIAGPSSTFYWFAPIAAQQDLSGAGAINITTSYTAWTSTGVNAGTLVDGVNQGHFKKIQLVADAGDATLTPTNLGGGTTIVFADTGDTAELVFDGTNWIVTALYNLDGTTAPVLS